MISWDDAQTISQRGAQDTSVDGIAFLNMMMNVGYKEVLAALGRQVVEQQATQVLQVNVRQLQMPPDANMPKTLVLVNGTTRTNIIEEPSDRYWEARKQNPQSGMPVKYHFRPRFGVGGGLLELDPIPSSAYTIEMTYEATERDLGQLRYIVGTTLPTNASPTIVGTGTTWVADMVGRYFRPTAVGAQRLPYRIKTFTDATHLVLENVYHGSTPGAPVAYEIFEMFALPEDLHMLPIYYALWQWWNTKGNINRTALNQSLYENGLKAGKERHALTSRDNVIDYSDDFAGASDDYPPWFPSGGVTS